MLFKTFLAIILIAGSLNVNSLPVYSSIVTEQRSAFCRAVEATAKTVVKEGLTPSLVNNIQQHPVYLKLTVNEQLMVFDAVLLADRRKSSFWVFEYCMDRVEA